MTVQSDIVNFMSDMSKVKEFVNGSATTDITTTGGPIPTLAKIVANFPGGKMLSGLVAPTAATGNNNDFYIDTKSLTLYGPKAAGAWPAGRPLASGRATSRSAKSIMFMGDSITAQNRRHTKLLDTQAVAGVPSSNTYPNLNASGMFVQEVQIGPKCPVGAGTLRYYVADNSLTWQAFGDSEGPRVVAAEVGDYMLPSGTAGNEVYLAVIPRFKPVADKVDTVNITAGLTFVTNNQANLHSYVGLTQLLLDSPFSKVMSYAIANSRASEWAAATSWRNVYSDITSIFLGTNDIFDLGSGNQCALDVENIILMRLAIGSTPVLWTVLPATARTAIATAGVLLYNQRLRDLAAKYNCDIVDMWSYAVDPTSATGAANLALYKDNIHPNAKLHYIMAKRGLVPVLRKYVNSFSNTVQFAGIPYNSGTAPYGNLLPNPLQTGAVALPGTAGVSGEFPTNWTITRSVGSVLTAVCKSANSASPKIRADGKPGNWTTITADNTGGAAGESIRVGSSTAVSSANYVAGDRLEIMADMQIVGTGIQSVVLQMSASVAAGGYRTASAVTGSSDPTLAIDNFDGDTVYLPIKSPVLTIETGDTNVIWSLTVSFKAGGQATIDLGQTFNIRKLAA